MADEQYYQCSRPEVAALVPQRAERILDIGCGAGQLGRHLKQRQQCWVSGIEVVEAVAEQARAVLDEVLVGDVEMIVRTPPRERFDCIVCADVLEHLREPGQVLEKLREGWLAPGGVVVASVPNVRHWSVIRQLLEGRWDYADAGLLDRTHLRFFTRTTLYFLFAQAGYQILSWRATRLADAGFPRELLAPLSEAGLRVHTLEPETQDYQYLIVARPKPLPRYTGLAADPLPSGLAARAPETSIVIPVWNEVEYTRQCVESIFACTRSPFELILVDNGSTDGTPDYLAELRARRDPGGHCLGVRVIGNPENLGFGLACNQGMAAALGRYVVILNNDTVVTEGWLERMQSAAERDSRIGVVGPRSNFVVGPQMIENVPYAPDDMAGMRRFAAELAETRRGQGFPTARAIGLCLLIKRSVIDCVGGFDPRFGIGNFEDDDFSIRVLLAGFVIWIADDVFIHHYGSRTFSAQRIDYRGLMRGNLARLLAKWLGADQAATAASRGGQGYSLEEILRGNVFLPERHYEPLSPAELDQAEGEPEPGERRALRFLAVPRWDDPEGSWMDIVERYVRACGGRDDVSLLLRVDPTGPVSPWDAMWKLQEGARERGIDLEGGPDIVLVDDPLGPLDRGKLYRAADVLVAPGLADGAHVLPEARYFGLQVQSLDEAFPEDA